MTQDGDVLSWRILWKLRLAYEGYLRCATRYQETGLIYWEHEAETARLHVSNLVWIMCGEHRPRITPKPAPSGVSQ